MLNQREKNPEIKNMPEKIASKQNLGLTARWTAGVRAVETRREARLFDDPWAAALAGEVGMAWIAQRPPESLIPMIIRTRFFDDFLLEVTDRHGLRQVVILAAGLDTRAFRLDWPAGTTLFEIDQPHVLEYKQAVLQSAGAQPACARRTIALDLTEAWEEALVQAGFEAGQPAAWLLEGFLFYLPDVQMVQVLEQVSAMAAAGSWLGCDLINRLVLSSPWTHAWVQMQADMGAPWLGALDDPQGFFSKRGWQVSLTQAGAPDANYGRWLLPVIPTRMPGMPHNWYVTAEKI
jgi:methyltransferase (TIGR00027 family)